MSLRQRIEIAASQARPDKALRDAGLFPFVAVSFLVGLIVRGVWSVLRYVWGSLIVGWRLAWGRE